MSWNWSYTAEGVANIYSQIQAQPREWLEVCWAENQAAVQPLDDNGEPDYSSEADLDETAYTAALAHARELPSDVLADSIMESAEAIATCDNGGWLAWCCPWGCHSVPPDPVEEEQEATL